QDDPGPEPEALRVAAALGTGSGLVHLLDRGGRTGVRALSSLWDGPDLDLPRGVRRAGTDTGT
ncbi:hypothetical protein ABT282_20785, partial [Streptomyces sp. NPDC000927]|uniref:hypothetical protein n=1 Tax=Streptomyces sp. NPDC000927 TaxID=3154371 RepID=UPI00332A8AE0